MMLDGFLEGRGNILRLFLTLQLSAAQASAAWIIDAVEHTHFASLDVQSDLAIASL
jgi:hypothetical protein